MTWRLGPLSQVVDSWFVFKEGSTPRRVWLPGLVVGAAVAVDHSIYVALGPSTSTTEDVHFAIPVRVVVDVDGRAQV
jgi:hypothetical protein